MKYVTHAVCCSFRGTQTLVKYMIHAVFLYSVVSHVLMMRQNIQIAYINIWGSPVQFLVEDYSIASAHSAGPRKKEGRMGAM